MEIKTVPIQDLKQAEYNPRSIDLQDFEQLKRSLEKFGFVEPLVVNSAPGRENVVIGGNQRLKVATELGWNEAPINYVDIPSLEDEKELNIRLNRNLGQWNFEILKLNFDPKQLMDCGFEKFELEKNFDTNFNDDELQPIPELPERPRSKRGEIYILGRHRLMCGDSTIKENVYFLMQGRKADLIFTDPPYSVNYRSRKENPNEALKSYQDPSGAYDLLVNFISISPSDSLIMTYTDKQLHHYVLALEKLGWETIDLLIWKKNNFCFWPGARYQQQHELIFLARKNGSKFYSNTPPNRSTIFEVDRKTRNEVHPTERPVSLWGELIGYHTKKDSIIYDPFLGSGTTLIVAEQMNRICYGIEISEAFCDVIIKRYCNLTSTIEEIIYANAEGKPCPIPGETIVS